MVEGEREGRNRCTSGWDTGERGAEERAAGEEGEGGGQKTCGMGMIGLIHAARMNLIGQVFPVTQCFQISLHFRQIL